MGIYGYFFCFLLTTIIKFAIYILAISLRYPAYPKYGGG
jgi:hypothetical protein